jgi:hypothetical protein
MNVPFEKLVPTARTWIYQANRKMSSEEKTTIKQALGDFTEQWLVHGLPLEASFDIRHDLFVILAANDTTSGCSIDSSVRAMKEAGSLTGIDFFNRNLVAFKYPDEIRLVDLSLLKVAFQQGEWTEETLVFNNMTSTLRELEERWLVPAGSTWLKRYIPKPQSVQ